MKSALFVHTRRRLIIVVLAAFLALSASYTPILFDGMGGTSMTATAFACGGPPGGC